MTSTEDRLSAKDRCPSNDSLPRRKQRARRKSNWQDDAAIYLLLSVSLILLQTTRLTQGQEQPDVAKSQLPDLTSSTSDEPIVAIVGQDAFVSCVAKNLQNYTILWRFTNDANAPGQLAGQPDSSETGVILSAGRQRVIADDRFTVIQSHDTWLLKINNVRLSDTGTYICQTNSKPQVRALRILSVVKPTGDPDASANGASANGEPSFAQIDYNFTDCCRAEFVAPRCQRLCSLQQLASRYQSINMVHECYSSLPSITMCMVAGRNLTDCCQKRHIPAKCHSMCGHQGDTSAMSVQDQSYCADYSASIMSCVAEGISTLPGQPELVIVEAISSTTLKVSWQKVSQESELRKIDGWIINLTKLSSFEDTISSSTAATQSGGSQTQSVSSSFSSSSTAPSSAPLTNLTIVDVMNNSSLAAMTRLLAASTGTISLKLDKHESEFSIENLKPYTVYQIQMFAYNSLGKSQLTDPIRALTLAPESSSSPATSAAQDAYVEPSLPDTRKCCLDGGVTLKRCLDTLCDPVEADRATIADLMICAPWSNVTFSCLASRVNHTDCCKSRGVSPFCLSMCSGDVKRVDYRHFRCLTHMSSYTNCILESHNVLPSAPQNFTVGPITHTWAVLNWRPPKRHARSLQGYRIYWRRMESAERNSTQLAPMGDPANSEEFFYMSAEAATNPYLLDALQAETVYETFVMAVNKFGQSEASVRFVFQTLADPARLQAAGAPGDELDSRLPQRATTPYNESACCLDSGVHSACRQLCDYDIKVSDVSSLISSCNTQMPTILRCMAGARNSVPCCRARGVADQCLNVCAGLTEHSPLVVATRCAPDFGKIVRCMDEGSKLIPGAPVDLHTLSVGPDRVELSWQPADEDKMRNDIEYHVRYQQLQPAAFRPPEVEARLDGRNADQPGSGGGSASSDLSALIAVVPLHPLEHNLILTSNKTDARLDKLKPNSRYSIYVTAENNYGISLPSLVLVIQTPADEEASQSQDFKRKATLGAPHSLEILRADTDSIVLKWIAPLFISSDAQIKYRVFYKMLGPLPNASDSQALAAGNSSSGESQQVASNWTVLETSDTNVALRNLRYSSQYVITVQAYSKQLLGHMSEILLAYTARPVPPSISPPSVLNPPIEGHNITIMCVAIGQPMPQISMFINGLLVQKRTQPYVIYHLVNLVRGHLTISCFASNGHGKDYASVQSRTEVSVKFPAKTQAKSSLVRVGLLSTSRLTCEVSGNPQPSLVWTYMPSLSAAGEEAPAGKPVVITPNERITTLLVSQFDNPFTWSHTLTIRNVTAEDFGHYQCRARNSLAETSDSIRLISADQEPAASANSDSSRQDDRIAYLKTLEQNTDLTQCCRAQNVSDKCLPVCSPDGLDVDAAFKIPECQPHLDKLMYCAADGSDHRNCCRQRQVPSNCLRWCSGAKLNIPALCFLSSAIDINQCFQDGRLLLPGPPRNLKVTLASEFEHNLDDQLDSAAPVSTMDVGFFMSSMFERGQQPATSDSNNNNHSVIRYEGLAMSEQPAADGSQSQVSKSDKTQEEEPSSQVPPLIISWDAPSKNPALVRYYRVFWRPLGSRELSRTVTNLTWIRLNELNMNRAYEFVVKAANTHGSSVYSEPLTFKPAEVAYATYWSRLDPANTLLGRVMVAFCFATFFMFTSLFVIMLLEKRGYLRRFASSKSNSSRVSFANPAYSKESDNNQDDQHNITWDTGHSLDILAPPTQVGTPRESSA